MRRFITRGAREELCAEIKAESCGMVIFGASGDLARRKLLPALFELFRRQLLPANFFILGGARTEMDDDAFRRSVRESLAEAGSDSELEEFSGFCHYIAGSYEQPVLYEALKSRLAELEAGCLTGGNRIYYLATPPVLYPVITEGLGRAGLTSDAAGGWSRVVVEKPFGRDLVSARELDRALLRYLTEQQIYRIDHYLGKETVQNIMILRFANTIFEPVWNRQYIDHVQITVAETLGVENRAGYYDQTGALRDMFQNHMLEMLSLVAMEPPASFDGDRHRDEKVKLLRAIRPYSPWDMDQFLVRGQYAQNSDKNLPAYRQEPGIKSDSTTETYAAMQVMVDNWRWRGVPFYLRSGKRLARKVSEIAIAFKPVPHSMFAGLMPENLLSNVLVLAIQPEEGIALSMETKRPGPHMCMSSLNLQFSYRDVFGERSGNAYERLLLDCMAGDQTLFVRRDGAEVAWNVLDPILQQWQEETGSLCFYPAGAAGPEQAEALLAKDGRAWRPLGDR
ncbi:glucose-6-phosphate dehydrogenase [Acetonema longum]|uniref:Glucose-6-phosphate 1-dehydrogenase n=1 Tax=Acetonema longum DSM 6540 TaxID=1009370 RepID=F7NJ56_9FIRM|nr:glucose-6-phosphate dehydrogenase [Acetonema longum]EGO63946.1 glucose-6-phosphate 1-dehydrogenase [Acetonema longum DSM 6540]